MTTDRTTIRTFWWRPTTGSAAQVALDAWQFRPRRSVRGRHFNWRMRNFGDELSALLVHQADPQAVACHADLNRADLVVVGSVLERVLAEARAGIVVLGAGFTSDGPPVGPRPELDVHMVRGPLSARRLGLGSDIPVGDPALALTADGAATSVEDGPLAILHFSIMKVPDAEARIAGIERRTGARAVFSTDPVETILDAVRRASVVYSSSLHGVIAADAYGKPALPITPGPTRSDFRFDDYHAALEVPAGQVWAVADLTPARAYELAMQRATTLSAAPIELGKLVAAELTRAVRDLI